MLLETLFFLACIVFLYVYFIYPTILLAMDKMHNGKPLEPNGFAKELRNELVKPYQLRLKHGFPKVSVIVPCHNEIDAIAEKVKNLESLHYPKESIEFIFVDDLSDDGTAEYLRTLSDERFVIVQNRIRLGKLGGMQHGCKYATGELLLFTDCAARLNPGAIKRMIPYFRNSATGIVTGIYKVKPKEQTARTNGEGLYWRYEMAIRRMESHLRTTTHATGSIFMVRKRLFDAIHWREGIINDDFFIPLSIIEMGFDVHSEPRAVATEYVEADVSGEFRRRSRIASGNFQMVSEVPALFKSHRYFTLFQLISHKLLRNGAGLLLPFILISNILLAVNSQLFGVILVLQVLFYCAALAGLTSWGKKGKLKKLTAIPLYFSATNIASAYGFFKLLSGKQNNIWSSTDRVIEGEL